MEAPELEKRIGITTYASETLPIGGRIRSQVEDFKVEEVLIDGSIATMEPQTYEQIEGEGSYLLTVLVKSQWDNILSLKRIARELHISNRRVALAGLKDAKASTSQYITFKDVNPAEVRRIHIPGIKVIPQRHVEEPISASMLWGNRFQIVVRDLKYPRNELEALINCTEREVEKAGGFLNFYGHQRFGTIRPVTHEVGKHLVKGNIARAALIFLAESTPNEHQIARQARENLANSLDYKKALKEFPYHLTYERSMLHHLAEKPRDFLGAFRQLPITLCRLFVQAYSAYLFNRTLNRLLDERSLTLCEVGDYILKLEPVGSPRLQKAVKVTKENRSALAVELAEGKLVLALPVLGYLYNPSSDRINAEVRDILEEEGVSITDFKVKHLPEVKTLGKLRAAIIQANDLNYIIPKSETSEEYSTVTFHFSLPKGSYATVVLREFMKSQNPISAGF